MTTISVTQTKQYELDNVVQAVKIHFERFSFWDSLPKHPKVVLKPNLLLRRSPEGFTTTHPIILEAVIICLKERGITDITIADSPGGPYTISALQGVYHGCGMEQAAKNQQVKLNQDLSFQTIRQEKNELVKQFPILTPLCEADLIINLPKLKTHGMVGLSGAVKNLFGSIPGLTKTEFHWRFPEKELFCEMLVDLCETVRPQFTIVDAIESMEGDGPSAGLKRESGVLIASDQCYDLDFYLCHLMGIPPQEIFTVAAAMRRGLCADSIEQLTVIGGEAVAMDPYQMPPDQGLDFMGYVPGFLKKPAKWFTQHALTTKPVVRKNDCIGCMKCASCCPVNIITKHNGTAVIDYRHCIHCFCCHELCPVRAIDLKQSRLFRGKKAL